MPFYWISQETDRPLKPGDPVPKMDSVFGTTARAATERTLEEIREKEFPDRPSRKGANFVTDDLHDVAIWRRWWFGEDSDVYEVEVSGKTFKCDGSLIMDINDAYLSWREHAISTSGRAEQHKRRMIEDARTYWEGRPPFREPEIVVQGDVRVVRKLEDGEMSLKEVRSIVRGILSEAVCPACGSKNAYIGLSDVECDNPSCRYFSEKQASVAPVDPSQQSSISADEIGKRMIDAVEAEGWAVDQDGASRGGYFVDVFPPPPSPKYVNPFVKRFHEIAEELSGGGWKVSVDRSHGRWRLVAS